MAHFFTAVTILVGAFAMVRQNVRGVAQHIGPAYLLWVVGTIAIQVAAFGKLTNQPLDLAFADSVNRQDVSVWLIVFAYTLHAAAYTYIAVAWHRVALRPDAVRPTGRQMGQYLWRLVQQSLVSAVMFFPLVLLVMAGPSMAREIPIFWEAVQVGMGWVLLRFGLILPAAAIERAGYGFEASWKDTARYAWPLLWIALFEMGIWAAITWASEAVGLFDEAAAFVVFTALWPIPFLVGLSVLTYLYQRQSDDAA